MSKPNLPSVFISYAHKDGKKLTHNLALALDYIYMDVFWDIKVEGEYKLLFENEIKNRDFFLFIMTPASLKSEPCREELDIAKKNGKKIVVAKYEIINEDWKGKNDTYEYLTKYIYGDFDVSYEEGFKCITRQMLGQARLPWEYLQDKSNEKLYDALQKGHVPFLICNEFLWDVFAELWKYIKDDFPTINGLQPKTIKGFIEVMQLMFDVAVESRNSASAQKATMINEIIQFAERAKSLSDKQTDAMGLLTKEVMIYVDKYIKEDNIASRDIKGLMLHKQSFDFNTYEQLRALIRQYADIFRLKST